MGACPPPPSGFSLSADAKGMRWLLALSTILLAICLGCGRRNGLPQDVARHLADNGITLKVTRSHAPLSSRGGYLIAQHDIAAAKKIVSTFNLPPVPTTEPAWQRTAEQWKIAAKPTAIFGATARPTALKLKNGSQLEYLYLVVMDDGTMWLFAEYAYG